MWFIWHSIVPGSTESNDPYPGVDISVTYSYLLGLWCGYLLDGF